MSDKVKNNVFQLRSRKGITQEELARVLGVSRQTVIAIEKDNYTPSVSLALKISKFFKKSVNEIFEITNKK
jgi:putative transcriptional regulator